MTAAICPWCGYDVPPIESRDKRGLYLGSTCQRCGWHPRFEPIVLPEVHADLSDERLRLETYDIPTQQTVKS